MARTTTTENQEANGRDKEKMSGMVKIVFVSLLLDLLAFTMILPLLPSLLDYYGNADESGLYSSMVSACTAFRDLLGIPDTEKYNSVLFGGIIGSLFSFLQFISCPITGAASDFYGRRPLMIISMVGIAASYVLWALSHNFAIFVLARIVGGLSKSNVSLSTTIVTDVSTTKTRGKGMALVGIAFSVGFIVGPLIGAFFASRGVVEGNAFYVKPALLALTLATADLLFILAFMKETLPEQKRAKSFTSTLTEVQDLINPISLFNFSAVKQLRQKSMLRQVGLSYFFYLFIFSGLEFTLTFLVHRRFNYTSMQQGRMFFFMGSIMALVQGGYVRRIQPGKEKKVALMGIIVLIPAFIIVGYATTPFVCYLGLTLFSFASATVVPCLTTLVSTFGKDDQKGTVLGIFRSLGALARAFGPIVASSVYWSLGATTCYIFGGVSLLLPVMILRRADSVKTE
ncbi:major facilitator superfamily domain-containing protein 10-like [Anneissia japonica]|uniref:major facilitator superfamily domain-containing protein 10-like n=1 Tax=Anneissia japonica TaxID=1529436 RepID=UPI0014254E8E|nr:major facilitator superfamily domain-containing protein 10-like [Anneissia japonica]